MAKVKKQPLMSTPAYDPPAGTEEARENQMIALAVNLAEQQLRDGLSEAGSLPGQHL